jgi:hypothetical protein
MQLPQVRDLGATRSPQGLTQTSDAPAVAVGLPRNVPVRFDARKWSRILCAPSLTAPLQCHFDAVNQATVHINLRLPADLHPRLRDQAAHDRRSLNAEIVWLLDRSLTQPA